MMGETQVSSPQGTPEVKFSEASDTERDGDSSFLVLNACGMGCFEMSYGHMTE